MKNVRQVISALKFKPQLVLVALSVLASLVVFVPQVVQASTVDSYFYVQLPDGSKKDLPGAKIHQVSVAHSNLSDIHVRTLASDECETMSSNKCTTAVSCTSINWLAPYLPSGVDLKAIDSSLTPVVGNIRGSNDPKARWVGESTGIQIISTSLPSQSGSAFVDTQPTTGAAFNFKGGSITNEDQLMTNEVREDFRQFAQVKSLLYPSYLKTWLDSYWKKGIGANNDWNNTPSRTQEVAYDTLGGNALQGTVNWTLTFPKPAAAPMCESFGLFKGTTEVPADGSIAKTDTITVKQANKSADGTMVGSRLCWTAKGLTGDQYQTGRSVFACVYTCNTDPSKVGKLVGVGDALGGVPAGLTTACSKQDGSGTAGSVSGSVDAFINLIPDTAAKTAAGTQGLIFTQDALSPTYSDSNKQFCGTNPGNSGVDTGIYYVGDGTTKNDTSCGVSSTSGNCLRRVSFATPPPTALKCSSISGFPAFGAGITAGTNTTLSCAKVDGATRYEYRIQNPTGAWETIPMSTAGAMSSQPYAMVQNGSYTAQCRPCKDTSDASCAPWGETPACSGGYTVGTQTISPVCNSTQLSKSTVTKGSTEKLSVVCRSIPGVLKFKLTIPNITVATGLPASIVSFAADTAGNTTYSFDVSKLGAGSYDVKCLPCTDSDMMKCAPDIAACNAKFTITEQVVTPPVCANTSIAPSSMQVGSTQKATITCTRVDKAVSYLATYPANDATANPITSSVAQPASGNATFAVSVDKLAAKSYNVSCVPCLGANGTNCIEASPSECKASFTMTPLLGEVSCVSKKAYRVETTNGADKLVELQNNAIVDRNTLIQYVVELATNMQPAKAAVTLKDTYNATAMKILANSYNPAGQITSSAGVVNMTAPAADVAAKATMNFSYRMTVNDLPQPTSIPNTVAITNNGQGDATNNACSFTLRRAANGEAHCESKTAYYMNGSQKVTLTSGATASYIDPGQEFSYDITLTAAELTTNEVTVVDTLSSKLQFVSASLQGGAAVTTPSDSSFFRTMAGSKLTFVVPAFGSEGSSSKPEKRVITVKVKVKTDATPGDVDNAVAVGNGGTAVAETACNNKLRVPPNGVAKCVDKTVALASGGSTLATGTVQHTGTELLYTINVKSDSLTAGNVLVTDQIPGGLEVTDKGDFATFNQSSGLLSTTLTPFTGTKALKFKAKIKPGTNSGNITNIAIVKTNDRNGAPVDANGDACNVVVAVASYACNSSCNANDQCKTVNNDYVCSSSAGNKCRLEKNQSAENCQPIDYACNSRCETDANCQSVNSNYVCYDAGSDVGKVCRLNSNKTVYNCSPPVATPTPIPTVGCNTKCVNNADCSNPSHVCYDIGSGDMRCRLSEDVTSASCTIAKTSQPVAPVELPQTGPENWSNWLKGGLVVIGIGAMLLLLI